MERGDVTATTVQPRNAGSFRMVMTVLRFCRPSFFFFWDYWRRSVVVFVVVYQIPLCSADSWVIGWWYGMMIVTCIKLFLCMCKLRRWASFPVLFFPL